MYKFPRKQIGLSDFGMPMGLSLNPDNRWVKKAETIPWEEIELRYAALFKNKKGNVAKPLRLALGALLIQSEYQYPDTEVPLQIQETPCLQYFCGMPEYKDELPFDSSLMVYFRKRLTPEILGEINEMIIKKASPKSGNSGGMDGKGGGDNAGGFVQESASEPENEGTLMVDSTCAPQNIRYPQDLSLLNEARENLEQMVDKMHDPVDGLKPRTYREKARNDFLKTSKRRKKTANELRRAIGKQLNYVRRDLHTVDSMIAAGGILTAWQAERLETIKELYAQQRYMHENRVHSVDDRIVSLSQPWVRPIVRGKARAKCEFGAKLDISVTDGFTRLENTSFDAYNESGILIDIIERYKEREGCYPKRVLADQIYRNRENLMFCKKHGIQMSGKPLGRPKRNLDKDLRRREYTDGIERVEVERKIGYAKGSFGLGLIRARLRDTSETAIALSIIAMNISHIGRILRTLFQELLTNHIVFLSVRKLGFVQ